jgi:enoyl-CoA hydratase/carnithine racemase
MSLISFSKLVSKIAILQLNNLSKKNALSLALIEELRAVIGSSQLKEYDIIILESLCNRVYSSGHDLHEINQSIYNSSTNIILNSCSNLMKEIQSANNIFIAEISGQLVTAAGLQLASSCDLIVSSSDSKFSIPGSYIGLYAATPAVPLIPNLPQKVLFDMLITGKTFSAYDMYHHGLINEIVHVNENINQSKKKEIIRKQTLILCGQIINQNIFPYVKQIKSDLYKISKI